MKIVFFRQLLLDTTTKEWSASQQIVYSYLLSQSIMRIDCVFETNGENIDYKKITKDYCNDGVIDLCDYHVNKVADMLNTTRQNVRLSIQFLRSAGYIQDELIRCPEEIIRRGFFELKTNTALTNQLLIFYSWLHDKAYSVIDGRSFNGVIDTLSYNIAKMFGTKDTNIRSMLSRLAKKDFVKRIATDDRRYGKLIIK